MKKFNLKIISPKKIAYENEVICVTVPSKTGEISILKNHIPLFSLLKEGILKIKDDLNKEFYFAIGGGYLETDGKEVTILVSRAFGQDEIDEKAILDAQKRAKETLAKTTSTIEREEALSDLRRSIVDLKLLNKYKRKNIRH